MSFAIYHREYYLEDCEGHREFARHRGLRPSRRLKKVVELLRVRKGDRVIDLGCGRGEVALQLSLAGARTLAAR